MVPQGPQGTQRMGGLVDRGWFKQLVSSSPNYFCIYNCLIYKGAEEKQVEGLEIVRPKI